jgi:hypothetical protein
LLAVIGFPHAENVAVRATRCVADDNHTIPEHPKAEESLLAVVFADVFSLEVRRLKYERRILEVELSFGKCLRSLRRIVGDGHLVSVSTSTPTQKTRVIVTLRLNGARKEAKLTLARPFEPRVCAQHGRELMGWKSPVGVPTWTHREQG